CERAVVLFGAAGEAMTRARIEPWLGGAVVGAASASDPASAMASAHAAAGAGYGEAWSSPVDDGGLPEIVTRPAALMSSNGSGNGNGYANGSGANGNGHGGHHAEGPMFAAPSGYTLEEIERETIVQTLRRLGGHRQKTAKALGIGVRTLGLKLKKWKEMELVDSAL